MSNTNRECYTCSTKYYYCPSCPSDVKKESFYNMFCCERCSKIFKLLSDETFKRITTAQCKKELINLDIKTNEVFKVNIKKHIDNVMSFNEPELSNNINVNEEIDSNENTFEQLVIAEEKKDNVEKIRYTSKRSKKSKNSEVDLKVSK